MSLKRGRTAAKTHPGPVGYTRSKWPNPSVHRTSDVTREATPNPPYHLVHKRMPSPSHAGHALHTPTRRQPSPPAAMQSARHLGGGPQGRPFSTGYPSRATSCGWAVSSHMAMDIPSWSQIAPLYVQWGAVGAPCCPDYFRLGSPLVWRNKTPSLSASPAHGLVAHAVDKDTLRHDFANTS